MNLPRIGGEIGDLGRIILFTICYSRRLFLKVSVFSFLGCIFETHISPPPTHPGAPFHSTMQELVTKMSKEPAAAGLHALKTATYTLHHLETGSGLRFVLNTDNNAGDLRPNLKHLYSGIFVDYVAKHPQFNPVDGSPIRLPAFDARLEEYLRSLACFNS